MAFEYGQEIDPTTGDITHAGSWGAKSIPKDAMARIIENLRLIYDEPTAGMTAALALKAPISSPTFTGTVTAPTFSGNLTGNATTATTAANSNTVAGLAVSSGINNVGNKIVRTDGNGYLQTGYINSSNGDEGNNSNPSRVWGTNGSDSYLRTYLTSALSVNYANSAGNAATATTAAACTGTAANADKLIGKSWHWAGQDGQPGWLWGGSAPDDMYVYNPSNFNVNSVGGYKAAQFVKTTSDPTTDTNCDSVSLLTGMYFTPSGTLPSGIISGALFHYRYSNLYIRQIFVEFNGATTNPRLFVRSLDNGTWYAWKLIG